MQNQDYQELKEETTGLTESQLAALLATHHNLYKEDEDDYDDL